MDYFSEKDLLPRGESWPLKRSLLDAALEAEQVAVPITSVDYARSTPRDEELWLLGVDYRGTEVPSVYPGTVSLHVYSVPSSRRSAIQEMMVALALPDASRWLAKIPSQPATWRSENRGRHYRLRANRLVVWEEARRAWVAMT